MQSMAIGTTWDQVSTAADEAETIARAARGDARAFEELVLRYERPIFRLAYWMMGDADDAAELTQETFMRAWKALPRMSPDLRLAAWLRRIVSNACLDVLRRRQRVRWHPWDPPLHDALIQSGPLDQPESAVMWQETSEEVRHVLLQMRARSRDVLLLREYDGLSCAEIGVVMGMSRQAVKSQLFRAREEFRTIYARQQFAMADPLRDVQMSELAALQASATYS